MTEMLAVDPRLVVEDRVEIVGQPDLRQDIEEGAAQPALACDIGAQL